MGADDTDTRSRRNGGTWAVVVAAVGFGFSPYLATRAFEAGVDPTAASFLRIACLLLMLLPCIGSLRQWPRESVIVALGGAASMLGFAGFYVALDRAPIAAATVVYYSYPAVVLAISAIVWKRRLRPVELIIASAVVLGVAVSGGLTAMNMGTIVALLPAFAAPIGWAIYLVVLSRPATASMPTTSKVLAGSIGGSIALAPLALWRTGGQLMPMTTQAATSVGLLTVCTLAIPALLVTWGAPRAGDQATAMIGSLEFVIALVVSWVLLGETLEPGQMIGISIVIAAAYAGSRTRDRSRDEPIRPDSFEPVG